MVPAAMQRATLATTLATDHANPWDACKLRVSAAKVENVEKAPQNPTVSSRKIGWDLAGQPVAPAEAWAISVRSSTVAKTFEAKVPHGESHPSLLTPS